jgi:universal stress protein E
MTQNEQEVILVVVEPTQDSHIALDRAIITSRLRAVKPRLHLFLGVDEEANDQKAKNPKLIRDYQWLESLLQPIKDENLEFTVHISWSTEWDESLLACAEQLKPDSILIPDYEASSRRAVFTDAKWNIMRRAHCAVMICRPGTSGLRKKILAAVNIQKDDSKYRELSERILDRSAQIAAFYDAELFVVNAYKDSLSYPNREWIMKRTGLPSKNVHARAGSPAEVISDYANEIGADLVVIGTMARTGARSLMRGNTSEKVLSRISQDVVTCC